MNSFSSNTPILEFSGSGFELGRQIGERYKEDIHAFLADGMARINHILYEPLTFATVLPTIQAYHKIIKQTLPQIEEEIQGLVHGAEISLEEALLLQLRRELMGYNVLTRGDCTTFSRRIDCTLGQTIDLNGDLESHLSVLKIKNYGMDRRTIVMVTFTGLLGYLGLNSHGLAIGINLVLGGEWKPGVPGYMALRHLLNTANSVEDCIKLVNQMNFASSRSFTFCDCNKIAAVEILNCHFHWIHQDEIVHTNHYLHEAFKAKDEVNVFAKNGSLLRLDRCQKKLGKLPENVNVETYFDILDHSPICLPHRGNIRHESTIAKVVMKPRQNQIYIKKGASESAPIQVLSADIL